LDQIGSSVEALILKLSFAIYSWNFQCVDIHFMHLLFSFLQIYPRTLSISSGESATIYVWVTVPVACTYDSSYPCKLVVEMVDFNEQFTSGSPKYCNESITALTKPSLCGLELNGWNTPWTWQSLTIRITTIIFACHGNCHPHINGCRFTT
jgi:hypothetical protein